MRNRLLIMLMLLAPNLLGAGRISQFEQKDIAGSTTHFEITAGTATQLIPAVAGKAIAEALVRCPFQTPFSTRMCYVSFDSSANFVSLRPGEYISWPIKGYLTQITVKAATAGTQIEVILNREP